MFFLRFPKEFTGFKIRNIFCLFFSVFKFLIVFGSIFNNKNGPKIHKLHQNTHYLEASSSFGVILSRQKRIEGNSSNINDHMREMTTLSMQTIFSTACFPFVRLPLGRPILYYRLCGHLVGLFGFLTPKMHPKCTQKGVKKPNNQPK